MLFKLGSGPDSHSHNEWTLVLLAVYLSRTPSHKTGKALMWRSVKSYISLIKGFLASTYGFMFSKEMPRLKTILKGLSLSSTSTVRRKRRGFRRRHFRALAKSFPRARGPKVGAVCEWAAGLTAWELLARGSELAEVKRSDLSFGTTSAGERYALLWLRPLKKKRRRRLA